ncbi:23S rRNA (guanosine(2251)-2'-O)-methyltransferase RlmB [Thermus thermophilus]|jgi:23S rRNA (guanosine2251-2'-O)-methyltransferase|uniref:RNA methyltransferase, TrmH family n=3 Tax=Thermus thermophilus TaxID=274 RepID=Q5SLJ7_THET8|nr:MULTISPECIES: 23S rRNA (guanosine(2251)-2'-O)-methyltransferase RlmB [Thermus]AAS82033.1 23S rRNA methyltransferase [Thermus thermophilus HB27]NHK39160.1 23S rRNA (guanosine(2251)-2'-O)-methyltransferase RlmB [Thermus thermophilus]QMV31743.1 23S rRNA (guanosine(2251)-2'-O)-methyltransferase RlmB [Thermus thermophilus]QZY58819.1 23S rRNA (guanosine(2251)-2'-O)-methyltransferase RlmB [Thermus thermophilus]WMV95120.1 23S rRNA (guanosine(2251)-2'-O)-methyltransferase RlmB [Thermus thermophilus 
MWIYGRNPVLEALRAGRARRVLVARGVEGWLLKELERLGAPYTLVPRIELDTLLRTTHHQGIAAEVEDPPYASLEDALRLAASRKEPPLLVALDGVTDPRNYGAMIRSALALGAHGVVSEERRAAPLSPLALKASAGAALKLPVVKVKNLPRTLKALKEEGLWVYGLDVRGEKAPWELDYARPLVLVVGSEGEGMRRLVRETCDELFRIPIREEAESLNASVALGIALYQARLARGVG